MYLAEEQFSTSVDIAEDDDIILSCVKNNNVDDYNQCPICNNSANNE